MLSTMVEDLRPTDWLDLKYRTPHLDLSYLILDVSALVREHP